MSEPLKVGDRLWKFDQNNRVYDKPGMDGRVIYSGYFVEETITGETKFSWLVGNRPARVNKKTMLESVPNYTAYRYYTDAGKADEIYRHENLYRIQKAMEKATADQLRRIEAILTDDAS